MQIPGNWHYSGLPGFYGRVCFLRRFHSVPVEGKRAYLCFAGVDYSCQVFLNGRPAGSHEGCFQSFEVEVTPWLAAGGDQELEVVVFSPNEEPGSVWPHKKRLIKGILSHWDGKQGSWDPERGQDGNTGGIWGDVSLEYRSDVHISSVSLHTRLLPKVKKEGAFLTDWEEKEGIDDAPKAYVWIAADLRGNFPAGKKYAVRFILTGEDGASVERTVSPDGLKAAALFVLPEPKLWWTWDLGAQNLYRVRAEALIDDIVCDCYEYRTGLCEIEVDGETGIWHINGKRLFIRGTNVIPSLWLAHYSGQTIARDIDLLKGAGMNAVRVCVHVSKQEFYEACDRAGILVWQDFLLQWGYANESSVVESACLQIKDMVRRLKSHPCIAVWCCQNESMFFNNEIVGPQLSRAAREEDASRYVHPVSHFREHPYPGWYADSIETFRSLPGGRMITEFGAQALPSVEESVEINGGDTWPPDWERLAYHDFQYDQTFFVAKVDKGNSWRTFVANSQQYQAKLLKTAIESFRHSRFTKVGSYFQFMFMDCWPAVTWSVVSHARVPKLAYQTLRQINQPVLVGTCLGRDAWPHAVQKVNSSSEMSVSPWVINDLHESFTGCVFSARLKAADGGVDDLLCTRQFDLPPDTLLDLPFFRFRHTGVYAPGAYRLTLNVAHNGRILSENHYDITIGQ
jgi:beta-mannosidase